MIVNCEGLPALKKSSIMLPKKCGSPFSVSFHSCDVGHCRRSCRLWSHFAKRPASGVATCKGTHGTRRKRWKQFWSGASHLATNMIRWWFPYGTKIQDDMCMLNVQPWSKVKSGWCRQILHEAKDDQDWGCWFFVVLQVSSSLNCIRIHDMTMWRTLKHILWQRRQTVTTWRGIFFRA